MNEGEKNLNKTEVQNNLENSILPEMGVGMKPVVEMKPAEVSIFLSKECINRLISDVRKINKNPLTDHNIFYKHDETNILKGYALIIGGEGTPYFGGYYLFEFLFTPKYPFEPPKIVYSTNDGKIRFNPNLYINGKTCLSILNTWKGEQWSPCQSITSILLSLSTVLNENPLLNEPGITLAHPDCTKYNRVIEYANIKTAFCDIVEKTHVFSPIFNVFEEEIQLYYRKNIQYLIDFCETKKSLSDEVVYISVYNLKVCIQYASLYERICRVSI